MYKSLSCFKNAMFDYAGLFPPENLSLAKALWNFADYQFSEEKKALGKFILPVQMFDDFKEFIEKNEPYFSYFLEAMPISVLFPKIAGQNQVQFEFANHVKKTVFLQKMFLDKIDIFSFEMPVSDDICSSQDEKMLLEYFHFLHDQCFLFFPKFELYLEIPIQKMDNRFFIKTLSFFNESSKRRIFLKFRTGAVVAEKIPPVEDIAQGILLCAEHAVPLKFTAGLHDPIPHYEKSVGAVFHGFLNVVSVAFLCFGKFYFMKEFCVEKSHLIKILENFHQNDFRFVPEGFYVGTDFFENELIQEIREKFVKGIGTCSFLEPIEKLEKSNGSI